MLQLTIGVSELFDETTSQFIQTEGTTIELEHSLVSLSKWESKFEKPFLVKDKKEANEILEYIKMMTLTPNVNPEIYDQLTSSQYQQIDDYINAKMTATWFNEDKGPGRKGPARETITSELVYYWMVALTIPFECQNWHLNRLITLIRVCNIKNQPPKKMRRGDIASRNRELNAMRKAQMGTNG